MEIDIKIDKKIINTNYFFLSLDKEWIVSNTSGDANNFINCDSGEAIGKTFWEVGLIVGGTEFDALIRESMDRQVINRVEVRCYPLENWYSISIFPSGEGIHIYFEDISNEKKKEREDIDTYKLKTHQSTYESLELLKTILDNSQDGINMLDLKTGIYKFLNEAQVRLTGFTREEINNISFEEVYNRIHPEDREKAINQHNHVMSGMNTKDLEFRWKIKSGEYRWLSDRLKLVRDEKGRPISIVGISRDITEQKKIEDALLKSEEKYRSLFISIDEGFCIIELIYNDQGNPIDYKFIEVNPAFEKQIGFLEVVGKCISNFELESEEWCIDIIHKVALTGESIRFINELKSLDRSYSNYAFKIADNNSRRVAILFNEITKEVKDKQKMEEVLKAQEEFFINISHELRTPLNLILGTLQLLELKEDLQVSNQKYFRIMKQNCYRLLRLVNNVIDITKADTGFYEIGLQNCNIVNIVENICNTVAEYINEKGIKLIFYAEVEKERKIACNPDSLERIMLNLISNSLKFTDINEIIRVTMHEEEEYIIISVKDTGCGIPKDKLDTIFQRFKQVDKSISRSHEGSGIGLSLVKTLVNLLGGEITVHSEVGVGSEFIIKLPITTIPDNDTSLENNKYTSHSQIERIKIEFSDIYK